MKFDAAYYQRFYRDPKTRAASPREQRRQARFIASYLQYLDIPVHRILDLGCGLGIQLDQLSRAFKQAECVGVELSRYLCEEYGWSRGSVLDYSDDPFDLVICNDVLGYLDTADCAQALDNIAELCSSALYLSVLTAEDLDLCDRQATDMRQQARPHDWYRDHLDRHFVALGGGLFLRKPLEVGVWRLERL